MDIISLSKKSGININDSNVIKHDQNNYSLFNNHHYGIKTILDLGTGNEDLLANINNLIVHALSKIKENNLLCCNKPVRIPEFHNKLFIIVKKNQVILQYRETDNYEIVIHDFNIDSIRMKEININHFMYESSFSILFDDTIVDLYSLIDININDNRLNEFTIIINPLGYKKHTFDIISSDMNSTLISLEIKEKVSCIPHHYNFSKNHQYKLNTQISDDISLLNDFMNIFKSVYQKNHPFFKYLKIKYHIIINERTERLFSFKFVYPVKNYSSFTYTININDLKFDNKLLKDLLKDLNESFNIDMKLNTEEDIINLKKLMTMYYF